MPFRKIFILFLAIFSLSTNCMPWAAIRQSAARVAAVTIGAGSLRISLKQAIEEKKYQDLLEHASTLDSLSEDEFVNHEAVINIAIKNGINPKDVYLLYSNTYFVVNANKKDILVLPSIENLNLGVIEHEFSHLKNNEFKYRHISQVEREIIFLTSILANTNPLLKVLTLAGANFLSSKAINLRCEQRADENIQENIQSTLDELQNSLSIKNELKNKYSNIEIPEKHKAMLINTLAAFFTILDEHPSTASRIIRLKERLWGKDHPEEYAKLMDQREQEDNARKMLL